MLKLLKIIVYYIQLTVLIDGSLNDSTEISLVITCNLKFIEECSFSYFKVLLNVL